MQTLDFGLQTIKEVHQRSASGRGPLTPVRIEKDAIGNTRDLLVSPQMSLLVFDRSVAIGSEYAPFVSAYALVNEKDVNFDPIDEIEYFLLIFERSVVVAINDVPAFFPNPFDFLVKGDG